MMSLFRIDVDIEVDGNHGHYHQYYNSSYEFAVDKLIIKLGGVAKHEITYDYRLIKYLRIEKEVE